VIDGWLKTPIKQH